MLVLVASGLKLLGVGTVTLGVVLLVGCLLAPLVVMAVRRQHGLPVLTYAQGR